ncbi:hypothetical protein LTR05_000940 [Lithohypha guttulata]|uniref:Uncharacterized protein n=1 Tax=Lithohypha guttulata TaxID=1690604 RepID=A0AAN7TCV7_9EURO|nr:hypothetical protein LTR05_000940 [Lithohypha guttulata]
MAGQQQQATANASAPQQKSQSATEESYRHLLEALLSYEHVFYSPPTSPHKAHIKQDGSSSNLPTISSLSLHPVIESVLHLLNCDLRSAHFLCRHAQVNPKFESMFIHGILHRIEGDVDNTRAWYGDVKDSEIFQHVWLESTKRSTGEKVPDAAHKGWRHFLDRVERYRDRTSKRKGSGGWDGDENNLELSSVKNWAEEERLLREGSLWELQLALRFCERKFGVKQMSDARQEFIGMMESGDEKHVKIAQSMVTGGEGWREF